MPSANSGHLTAARVGRAPEETPPAIVSQRPNPRLQLGHHFLGRTVRLASTGPRLD